MHNGHARFIMAFAAISAMTVSVEARAPGGASVRPVARVHNRDLDVCALRTDLRKPALKLVAKGMGPTILIELADFCPKEAKRVAVDRL